MTQSLPKQGESRDRIMETLAEFRHDDLDWKSGRTYGFVYDPGNDAVEIGKEAYALYLTENGLDPTSFPSLMRLENEVIAIARARASGSPDVVGTFTSGGTESIMLAVKSAREEAFGRGISIPEMVLPVTAHAAFHKAAAYLGVRPIVLAVDEESFLPDPASFAKAVTDKTILLVASAPSYAHGVIDPIEEIATIARDRHILCHVDACVGGFLLPWFRELGAEIPPYDFSVEGVTSLSMDLHKYAFTPKGASVILYREASLRARQIFACASWTGYSVVNTAVQSSKTGGPLAAAYAVLHRMGERGYRKLVEILKETTDRMIQGIEAIPSLRILGRPAMCLFSFAAEGVDVFRIADEMKKRHWYVQPQLARGGSPPSIHLTLGPTNAPLVDAFLADLRKSVEAASSSPPAEIPPEITAALASINDGLDGMGLNDNGLGNDRSDDGGLDDEAALFSGLMQAAGIENGRLPDELAPLNGLLNSLPPALVERLLIAFMNQAFR